MFRGDGQLAMQAVFTEQLHSPDESGLDTEIRIRFKLDDPPDSLDPRVFGHASQCPGHRVAVFERCPWNDGCDARVRVRERTHPVQFREVLFGFAVALHEHHRLDFVITAGLIVIGHQIGPVDGWNPFEPRVIKAVQVPEMNMRVDHGD